MLSAYKKLKNGAPWEVVSKEARNFWHEQGNKDFISFEPPLLNTWHDALLAGLSAEMSKSMNWDVADWCLDARRSLTLPLFVNCPTELLRSLALTETAEGFTRHNLFIGKLDIFPARSGRFHKPNFD